MKKRKQASGNRFQALGVRKYGNKGNKGNRGNMEIVGIRKYGNTPYIPNPYTLYPYNPITLKT